MSATFAGWDERTLELAADRVTVGLERGEREELRSRARAEDLEAFEHAAAAVCLAGLGEIEAPPQDLLRRLAADGAAHAAANFAGHTAGHTAGRVGRAPAERGAPARARSGLRVLPYIGWLAAAGLLVALVLIGRIEAPNPSARLAALRGNAADLVEVAWAEPETSWGAGVTGEVVWSAERQEGYLRFRGLDANDPNVRQYQLWVFDSARVHWQDEPVDGGVFDVPPGAEGDVVIPIDAKLRVDSAALFAVTLEEPGGVVVSRRERMVVTATP